ncbi:hypothetical protein Y1Q_0007927 [Alligator mississippiensis]|uniref:Uncharacterized protein n=1 Tax=Alligator mississippiensis TaxID=8496 RepID=A0A151NFA7_ALLMI|nr:hypothetical protein Y1Q_0007927 [Alligator mississippiensis]
MLALLSLTPTQIYPEPLKHQDELPMLPILALEEALRAGTRQKERDQWDRETQHPAHASGAWPGWRVTPNMFTWGKREKLDIIFTIPGEVITQ